MVELLLLISSLSLNSDCTPDQAISGSCTNALIDNGGVTLDGTLTTPGSPATDIGLDGGGNDTVPTDDPNSFCENRAGESYCWSVTPPEETASSPVTLADIAHFRPAVGTHGMQPNGWVVAGLPANFLSSAAPHTVDGTLLGAAASVRFTPVAWHWAYGDGGRASVPTGGAPWSALGLREFGPTPTSHVYARRGTYAATLTVEFRAEYQVAGAAWVSIAGTLPVEAPPLAVTATDSRTVLVNRDCVRLPRGPGC